MQQNSFSTGDSAPDPAGGAYDALSDAKWSGEGNTPPHRDTASLCGTGGVSLCGLLPKTATVADKALSTLATIVAEFGDN